MNITKKILVLTLLQGLPPGLLCQKWEFPSKIDGLIGSCVEIPCTFYPPGNSRTSSTVWYLYHRIRYPQIFNSQGSSEVLEDYKGRTSLVHGSSSCSLRIDPVRKDDEDDYYTGIAEDRGTNAYSLHSMYLRLHVTGTPNIPQFTINHIMLEGRPEDVTCSVEHTCRSSPPSLKWNKPGQTGRWSEDLAGGKWREILRLRYIPSHEDDKTQIQCTATYHNGETSRNAATLDIRYAPKDVTVSLPENTEFPEGSDVILTCNSRSNPPPLRYEWYSTNSKIKAEPQSQKVIVRNINRETEPYSCAAINDVGRGESPPTKIPMQYAPKDVTVSLPQNTAFVEGSDVILTCNSRSNPPPLRYEWYRTNSKIKVETQHQKYKVLNVSRGTEPFSCAAINDVGRGESPPTKIPVQYAATGVQVIVLHPSEGATELKCSFVSSNPSVTHYTWMKDGMTLVNKTGQILVLDSNEDESGSYSCTAHNTAGSSNSPLLDFQDNNGAKHSSILTLILEVSAGVILLIMIVYFNTRKKRLQKSRHENLHLDATYTDLVKKEISKNYDNLQPSFPAPPAAGGKDLSSENLYENVQRKE